MPHIGPLSGSLSGPHIGPHIDVGQHVDVGQHIDAGPHDAGPHIDAGPHDEGTAMSPNARNAYAQYVAMNSGVLDAGTRAFALTLQRRCVAGSQAGSMVVAIEGALYDI